METARSIRVAPFRLIETRRFSPTFRDEIFEAMDAGARSPQPRSHRFSRVRVGRIRDRVKRSVAADHGSNEVSLIIPHVSDWCTRHSSLSQKSALVRKPCGSKNFERFFAATISMCSISRRACSSQYPSATGAVADFGSSGITSPGAGQPPRRLGRHADQRAEAVGLRALTRGRAGSGGVDSDL
jgi:hypothetical protein